MSRRKCGTCSGKPWPSPWPASGSDEMYIEKLILNPRHIEFQILADKYGNVIQLGERIALSSGRTRSSWRRRRPTP